MPIHLLKAERKKVFSQKYLKAIKVEVPGHIIKQNQAQNKTENSQNYLQETVQKLKDTEIQYLHDKTDNEQAQELGEMLLSVNQNISTKIKFKLKSQLMVGIFYFCALNKQV